MAGYGIDTIKRWFKNHVAELKILNDETQVLIWKQPDTRVYEIDFVFFKNMVYITGDMRDAVFNTTWHTSWNCNKGWRIDLSYFASKLSCATYGKYVWDSREAVKYLVEEYRDCFDGGDYEYLDAVAYIADQYIEDEYDFEVIEIPYKESFNDERSLLQMCLTINYALASSSTEEFANSLKSCSDFEDFNDFWEWGYSCGRVINPDIEVYLVALQMAYDQLSSKEGGANDR